ncbi:MAG: guanylate kinase [Oscillospiraceae bacterium]|nr:guanylate kinase [Oscillospiraceae bacterium]
MAEKGKLIILSGPSGVGKSTIVFKAMQERSIFCFSTSVTTREPRPGEVHGREYFFIDQERFDEMVAADELLEYASYVNHSYGTPRSFVEEKLEEGMNVILDIEIQGARQVYEKIPEAITVFILPPSMETLRERLIKRGTDSRETIEARIRRACQEIEEADFYDYLIVNEDVETAAKEFNAIITAEYCRFDRTKALALREPDFNC